MDFRSILIKERQLQGLTQKELADKCNIKPQLISRYESGQAEPIFSTGITVLNALGFDLANLNAGVNSNKKKDSLQDIAAKLNKHLSDIFSVIATTRTVTKTRLKPFPNTLEEMMEMEDDIEEITVENPVVRFTAIADFSIDNLVFSKGDIVDLCESDAYDLNELIDKSILQAQKKAVHDTIINTTKEILNLELKIKHLCDQESLRIKNKQPLITHFGGFNLGLKSLKVSEILNPLDPLVTRPVRVTDRADGTITITKNVVPVSKEQKDESTPPSTASGPSK